MDLLLERSVLLVTPDLHRIHHSAVFSEPNRNFGILLPWWDRLGGSYRVPTRHGSALPKSASRNGSSSPACC